MDEKPVGSGVQRAGAPDHVPSYWYECNHVAHRCRDGGIEYIGFACRHDASDESWPRVLS